MIGWKVSLWQSFKCLQPLLFGLLQSKLDSAVDLFISCLRFQCCWNSSIHARDGQFLLLGDAFLHLLRVSFVLHESFHSPGSAEMSDLCLATARNTLNPHRKGKSHVTQCSGNVLQQALGFVTVISAQSLIFLQLLVITTQNLSHGNL